MESLHASTWDVVISGTGLSQSLVALALSRSGRKVLHLDKRQYYGGTEAALSLDEAESWAAAAITVSPTCPFSQATLRKPEHAESTISRLGFSRAYSLSLSPQIIYARSNLLSATVASKVYRQLEFLAVGSWWIYDTVSERPDHLPFRKIPSSGEDVVNDTTIDLRSKRSVMRFLQMAADADAYQSVLAEWGSSPFPDLLSIKYKIDQKLQSPLFALTLSPHPLSRTNVAYALPRIHRHLTSIGIFGPGFGAVIPKWGGLAEVAQVACRAGAVGGGTYVLGKGITDFRIQRVVASEEHDSNEEDLLSLTLSGDEKLKSKLVVGSQYDLPARPLETEVQASTAIRSIAIVSSPLTDLFPSPAEGAPPSSVAIVVFPSGLAPADQESAPIQLSIHSSDTGECPNGQCVIYSQTISSTSASDAFPLLAGAVDKVLAGINEDPKPEVLWSMQYTQVLPQQTPANLDGRMLTMPDLIPSFVLEDDVLDNVRAVWEQIVGEDYGNGFMSFENREGVGTDDGDEGGDGEN